MKGMTGMTACKGTTIVEALIALLVLSAGIYAMLALQLASMKTTRNAYYQSQALLSARSAAELLLANPSLENTGLAAWSETLPSQLPEGSGIVCRDSTPDDGTPEAPACENEEGSEQLVIKVWWTDHSVETTQAMIHWTVNPG